jgi:heme exporter protein B
VPREAIFLGKAGANLAFVLAVQAVAMPGVVLLYNVGGGMAWLPIAGIAVMAAIGLVAVGTLFSSVVANTRLAELLLPLLALPFFVPIVTSAAQATAQLLAGRPIGEAAAWLKLLAAYDLVFVAACTWIYPHTLDG